MKISIDTKEDSHDDLKKVIKMLQHIVGDSGEVFTNQQPASETSAANPFANIFGDTSSVSIKASAPEITSMGDLPSVEALSNEAPKSETVQNPQESTDDLFAELFSEDEIKKMDAAKEPEDEEEELEVKSKSKKYNIEFY